MVDARGGLRLRHAHPSDYARVLGVIDQWWDGRPMSSRLSHVFFSHFTPTSFVIETDTEFIGFLLGFLSQTRDDEAHIHFAGVQNLYQRQRKIANATELAEEAAAYVALSQRGQATLDAGAETTPRRAPRRSTPVSRLSAQKA